MLGCCAVEQNGVRGVGNHPGQFKIRGVAPATLGSDVWLYDLDVKVNGKWQFPYSGPGVNKQKFTCGDGGERDLCRRPEVAAIANRPKCR